MKRKPRPDSNDVPLDVPLVLADGDSFLQIIASETIPYEVDPDCESIITVFVVARVDCTYDIVLVMKTFRGEDCISRVAQQKQGIAAGRIGQEVADIERVFSKGIEDATGFRIQWHRLDLADIAGRDAQVAAITAWGKVGVKAELGGIS